MEMENISVNKDSFSIKLYGKQIDINRKSNLYIIKVYGADEKVLYKFGYSTDIIGRITTYKSANPLTEVIGTYYREDAKEFELYIHGRFRSELGDEWYSYDTIQTIIDIINDKEDVLDKVTSDELGKKVKHKLIKDDVIEDFLKNKQEAIDNKLEYMPTGVLKYYLFTGKYPTYAGKVIKEYCKENNIQIVHSKQLDVRGIKKDKTYMGCKFHGNMRLFIWGELLDFIKRQD